MEKEKGVAIDDEPKLLGIKLRKGIILSKKGGQFTPVPSWKMEEEEEEAGPSNSFVCNSKNKPSARKLGASLWEVQNQMPLCNNNNISVVRKSIARASEPNSPIWPQSASRLMKRIGASFDQHDLTQRTDGDFSLHPSAANSSVETSSLNHTITPSSSLNFKGRLNSGYNIKTSAELIKVLNRIWSLEEELASNVSLVKSLKSDLRHAHSRIQELMQEQQSYRYEMDDLMKRVSQDKLTRKNKEHEKLKTTIQSIKNELEDEKKLRQRSESLHRKLGKELSEVNLVFKKTINDLESERNAHRLLEDLCDELSKGLLEHQQEYKSQRFNQSLHHISKLWSDERLKLKIAAARGDESEKNKILERLNFEIISFLQEKGSFSSRNNGKDSNFRRHSVESVHFNGVVSAPKDEDDDSIISDFHCFDFSTDAKNDEEGMERSKGKIKANLMNEKLKHPEKLDGHVSCSLKQERSSVSNGNKMNFLDSSRGNSSHSGIEQSVKENSLKEKLLEARLEGQNARLRALKGSSVVV